MANHKQISTGAEQGRNEMQADEGIHLLHASIR